MGNKITLFMRGRNDSIHKYSYFSAEEDLSHILHTYTFVDPNFLFLRQKNGLNGQKLRSVQPYQGL